MRGTKAKKIRKFVFEKKFSGADFSEVRKLGAFKTEYRRMKKLYLKRPKKDREIIFE